MKTIVGIDVGKLHHQATILDPDGAPFGGTIRFENTALGFGRLLTHLEKMVGTNTADVLVALEATGHYWLPLYLFLLDKGYKVQVFNPYQSDALRRMTLGRAKTDTIDAELVARLARLGNQKETPLPGEEILILRNLSRFRMELVFQASDVKRKVIAVLDVLFPEFEKLFSDVFGKASLALLSESPTPEEIVALDEKKLTRLLETASRKKLGVQTAKKIKEAATVSIGSTFATKALVFELKMLLSQIQFLKEQLAELTGEIETLLGTVDQQLIPGIGAVTAAAIIGELGDLARFPNVASVIAYAGLDPKVSESGMSSKQRAISKRGSKYLRTAIWQAAVRSLIHNPDLKAFYDKKRSEGKPKQVAIGAVANKLTRIIYGIMRSGEEYLPAGK
ncbi:MAG: IS110 family transposase [Candidatus Levyibacteriota bacterium]